MAAAGVPQVALRAVREPRWRAEPDAVRARLAALGLPVFVKPARLGSSVGIAKVGASRRARRGARARRSATTRCVIVEAFSRRARGRVLGARARRRARGLACPARSSCSRAPTGTTTRPSTPTAGWSCSCPPRISGRRREARPRAWPSRRSGASAAAGSRASTSSSRASDVLRQRAQHDARLHRRRASTRSCGRPAGVAVPRAAATGCCGYRARAPRAPSAAATRF